MNNLTKLEAIVAVYEDWGIGDGTTQPVVLSADRARFRSVTAGAAVIVGRKTMEDFPHGRPLKGRYNIVVTRQDMEIPEAEVVHSTEEALAAAAGHERCIVLGGASIFDQFFPYIQKAYITKIGCCPDSSRFFPNLDELSDWQCAEESPLYEENGIPYRFCLYERSVEGGDNHVKRQ
ncbi:MAG: dihydrofolate reductase [Oscillospiraceae bacterium]|nr:dihydrofolate reductase [Oscillospiraceae bacterium]